MVQNDFNNNIEKQLNIPILPNQKDPTSNFLRKLPSLGSPNQYLQNPQLYLNSGRISQTDTIALFDEATKNRINNHNSIYESDLNSKISKQINLLNKSPRDRIIKSHMQAQVAQHVKKEMAAANQHNANYTPDLFQISSPLDNKSNYKVENLSIGE